jgi:hypothetical protein
MLLLTPQDYLDGKITIPEGTTDVALLDSIGGFNCNYQNDILEHLNTNGPVSVYTEYIFNDAIKQRYSNLTFKFNLDMHVHAGNLQSFVNYQQHPPLTFNNFLCSFIGIQKHVGKKMLLAIINKFGWYNPEFVSKNIAFDTDTLDGHIYDYSKNDDRLYRKFFFTDNDKEFFNTINSFNYSNNELFDNCNHVRNILALENKLTNSFLHLISETMPDSYYPLYGEKFLYSVVTRGLFVSYASPYYHQNLKNHYGFRLYDTLFDYRFDSIENPLHRLVELITMISKYSRMSKDDWTDLYQIEKNNIDFNYHHYFSGDYLKCLERYNNPNKELTGLLDALEKLNQSLD